MAKAPAEKRIEVSAINMKEVRFNVVGTSPMIMNRFSQKAWQELLLPSARRSRASLDQSLKHDPINEFRGALYRNRDDKRPTLIHVPNGAFHGALAKAALDIPGAAKAKIERLTRVVDINIDLYGVPQVFCAMVRNSDMNHTPDVRTRPIFPEWACTVNFTYLQQVLNESTIGALFGGAGVIVGIGDWRGEKGGPFGAFRLCEDDDAEFKRIVKTQARAAQRAAYDKPVYFDEDTEELLTWFEAEVSRREKEVPSSGKKKADKAGKLPVGKAHIEAGNGDYLGTR